ncbi:hypothetical protein B0A50_05696 [Salinomyces thailandicus]|uniref:Uncharacterized protein n=1 Tax=Salinomyces thailandicus TaxID=706561 RepID=A0A4U0TRG5_9PEZI|nr:hypothetical protein B0A50_05696 [Salinomyces thailandica]
MAAPQGPICSAQTGTFAFRVYEYQPVDGSRKRRAPDRDDDLWVRPSKVTKGNAQEAAVCRLRCDLDCSRENLQHSQAAAEKLAREVQTRDVQIQELNGIVASKDDRLQSQSLAFHQTVAEFERERSRVENEAMAVIGGRDHEISGLRSELHRLQTAYSDLTAEAAASQDAVVEVGVTRAKAAGLESELHRLRTAYSDLTAEAAASKDAVVEVGVMRAKAAGLESDVVRLQTAYPDLVAKAAASDGAVAEARVMKDKVAALEADNAGLRQSERSQAQEIARLQQSLSSAREQDMPDATPLQEPDSASDSEEEPEEESEEESVEEAPKPMPKRKAQQVTAGAPGKAWGSLTSKRGSKTTSSRRNVAALTMPKLGSKPSGIVKRTGKSSAKKVESDAEAPESTAEQRKRRWRNMTTQERKAVDDAIWEKYMGSGSLYKPSPLHEIISKKYEADPAQKEADNEYGPDLVDEYDRVEYALDTNQQAIIIRRYRQWIGDWTVSTQHGKMIWLQERDDKRLFKAELCPTDLLPEFRRRFLPWQLEPGCRPTDDDIEGYKIECTGEERLSGKMTALYGTCSDPDEKKYWSHSWQWVVERLAKLLAFKNACKYFLAGAATTLANVGPWPARFVDEDARRNTSLQPRKDFPVGYRRALGSRAEEELSAQLAEGSTLNGAMDGLADMMGRPS